MGVQTIFYRLPLSAVRVSGTLKHTTDTILRTTSSEPAVGVELVTIGDPTSEQALEYTHGWLDDSTIALERSEDGRLTSTSTESTGQGAKALTAVSGLIATGVGFALGGVPGAALAATAGTEVRRKWLQRVGIDEDLIIDDERTVATAYRLVYGALADARVELAERVADLRQTISRLAGLVAKASDTEARKQHARDLRAAEAALHIVRSELTAIDQHFATWRASTMKSYVETVDRLITLDEFNVAGRGRVDAEGELVFGVERAAEVNGDAGAQPETEAPADLSTEAARAKLRYLWEKLELLITFEDDSPAAGNEPLPSVGTNELLMREPRWAVLHVSKRNDMQAVIESGRRYPILDNRCVHRTFVLRRSWFSKKSSKVTFSSSGVATGFASGSTSSVAAFAEAVGSVPGAVAASLKTVGEISDSVYSLRSKALDNELARVKKEVELGQQQVLDAGLDRTEKQAAALERLKQRQATLEARKAIIEASDAIEELQAPASPPDELARLQAEVALLRAQLEKALLQGATSRTDEASIDVADILRYTMPGADGA